MNKVSKTIPRYQEIGSHLRDEIADGVHRLGHCLPTEHALCRRFSASRFTIRKAIEGLRALGLVEARSGVGTFVISTRPQEKITHTLRSFEELLQYPAETYRKQLEINTITASPELAVMLHSSPGQEWVWLQAMRLAQNSQAPICWLNAYIAPAFASVLELPNSSGLSLLRQIEDVHDQRAAIARVEVSVTRVEAKYAEPLGVASGSPALVIIRRYSTSDGAVYLVTYSVHPENRFRLNFELEKKY